MTTYSTVSNLFFEVFRINCRSLFVISLSSDHFHGMLHVNFLSGSAFAEISSALDKSHCFLFIDLKTTNKEMKTMATKKGTRKTTKAATRKTTAIKKQPLTSHTALFLSTFLDQNEF